MFSAYGDKRLLSDAIAAGAREMIVVIPDAFTKYSGSMFSNSPTTGDWEAAADA